MKIFPVKICCIKCSCSVIKSYVLDDDVILAFVKILLMNNFLSIREMFPPRK